MGHSEGEGCLMFILWIGTIAISIGSGLMAWEWIEPDSFFGAVVFIVVWSILSYIGHMIAAFIVAILGGLK